MTTDQVLDMLRRKIGEVDLVASQLTDEELLQVVSDSRDLMELQVLPGFASLAVGTEQDVAGYGIVPDPSLAQGYILVLAATIAILKENYLSRLSRGELGVSWSSGLESESTISQAKAYAAAILSFEMDLEARLLVYRVATAGARVQ